jgi:hypothetical protein
MTKYLALFYISFFVFHKVRAQQEDSIVYIDEPPIVIHKTVEMLRKKSEKKNSILISGYFSPVWYQYNYKYTNAPTDYIKLLNSTITGNFTYHQYLALGLFNKKHFWGAAYSFAKLVQTRVNNTSYTRPYENDPVVSNHWNILLLYGHHLKINKYISFLPKIGLGTAIRYQQIGIIPTVSDTLEEDFYKNVAPMKKIAPIIQLEAPINLHLRPAWVVTIGYMFQSSLGTLTKINSDLKVSRFIHGPQLGLSYKLSFYDYSLQPK